MRVELLYLLHIVISMILAVLLSGYTKSRFKNGGKDILLEDEERLNLMEDKSIIHRFLFKFSLHKNNYITNLLFVFVFNLSLPVVGYIITIWISWYLKNVDYEDKISNTNILNLDEFGISFLKVERIFGEASMGDLMTSKYAPKSKKLRALSSLANNLSPANLKIIRQTLTSTDDEIRMFGYAIINKAEKSLNTKINEQLDIYHKYSKEDSFDAGKVAHAAQVLAPLYWELIYTELSHESLKENFLNEVVFYIGIAKDYYVPYLREIEKEINEYEDELNSREDNIDKKTIKRKIKEKNIEMYKLKDALTKLSILMGRVYMLKGERTKASTEFTVAQEIHEGELSGVLPYLAEIYFEEGKYSIVKAILNSSKNLGLSSTLYPIVEQWKKTS